MTRTARPPAPGDGPWHTRAHAAIRYAAFCRAAHARMSGPPGEQLQLHPGQLEYETLADTLQTAGVELGSYDAEVLGHLAATLDPLECAVVNSLIQRAAGDDYDPAVHVATGRRPRHLGIAPPPPAR
jgi:hypothetical protein